MRSMFAAIVICFSTSAFAGTNGYDLKIDLSLNGKNVISPRLLVKAGATVSIAEETRGDKTFVEVSPSEKLQNGQHAILMKFVVGKILADGSKKILSSPQIIALENSKAEIKVGKPGSGDELSLSVVAIRKAL